MYVFIGRIRTSADKFIDFPFKLDQYIIHFIDTPQGILNMLFQEAFTGSIKHFFKGRFLCHEKEIFIVHVDQVYRSKGSNTRVKVTVIYLTSVFQSPCTLQYP